MDITCSAEPCPIVLNATCVFYEGDNLIYTGINNNDNLQTALQKIDQKFQDAGLGYIFSNGIEQLVPGGAVMLGGALNKNTTIGGLYNLAFVGTLEASALITTGGTSTDFVKGDGSLDPTSYQPAGNYISNLTGDVIANGPGSVAATLATVFGAPGTYGNAGNVPSITVDGKGRITNVTPIPINYPAQSLSFVGDVEGLGFTGSPVTLTLDTVNTDVYGSNNFLKFAVNGKGLITSATPVSDGDITTALGYVPVNDAIELTINGVAHDLTANRDWEVGTVTTVGVSAGTGIFASVSNPNTNPVINIVNTAPDQTVRLTAGFGISISGSYPNFTITNDYPDIPPNVTSFSAGNLSPLFTTSVTNPTSTPALSFALSSAAANTVLAGPNGGAGAPTYRALVAADLPSLSYISNISVSAPLATTGGLTPTLSISQANSTTNGYLSSTDWNTFNNKQNALGYTPVPDSRQLTINGTIYDLTADRCWSVGTVTSVETSGPLTGGTITNSGTIGITQAGAGSDGYLSSADWNTFNDKQASGNYITDLTGDATASGPGSVALTLATVNATTGTFGSSTQVPVITVNNKGLVTCVTTDTISGSLEFVGDVTGVGSTGTCTSLTLATVNNDVYTSETLLNVAVNGKGLITSANPTTAGDICSTLGYTPENVANKSTSTSLGTSNTLYPTQLAVKTYVDSATAGGIILQGNWNAATNTPNISGTTTTGWAWRVDVAGTTNLGGITDWQVGDLAVKSATGWVKIDNTENVTSVFGRFGAIVATTGDYLTCQVTECGNLYYTDARVRAAVGHVAPLTYNSTTGVFGISQSNATTDGYLSATDWNTFNDKQPLIAAGTTSQYYRGDKTFQTLDTSVVTEGSNLYFTDARARGAVCAASGVAYNSTTGQFTNSCPDQIVSLTGGGTTSITGTYPNFCITSNDCFTGTVTSVAVSGTNIGVTGSPITSAGTIGLSLSAANVCSALGFSPYNSTNPAGYTTCTGTVTSVAASTSTTGVSITGSPITSSGTLGINVSTASSVCTGLLTAADWNTFNSHTSCTGTVTSVGLTSSTAGVSIACSPVTTSGTISLNIATASSLCTGLLTASDWNSFNSRTSCTGTVTSVNATGTNISVTGGPITTSGTLAISLSGANVCSALGYTPYNASNPNGYTTCVGTVTSAGIVATNINVCNSPVTTSGNICLNLTGANVCSALGFSPAPSSALSAYLPLAGGTMSGILCSTYNTASGLSNLGFNTAVTTVGNIHIQNGAGPSNDNSNQAAITFQGGTASQAQAGIYVLNNNSYGTSMAFATTNSYAAGPQIFMTASNGGVVNFTRANPTVQGNQILNAGNYNSYSPTLTGGGASGTWGINVTGTAASETLNTVTSRGNTTSNAVTVGLFIAQGPGGNYNENIRLPGSTAVISFNTSGATGAGSYNIVSQTNFQIRNAGGTQVFIMDQSGNLTMSGSMRAPIFYDSDDTGYYADFNSTSNSAMRVRGGTLYGPNPTWGAYLQVGGNGWGGSYASVVATNGNLHLDSAPGYAMYLNNYANGVIYFNGGSYYISSNGSYYNGRSEQVTINYNNDSNSTYQLLWGSGNNVYGTAQVYVNPSSDIIYARGGYISPGNAWGTGDSAFFPNGITTAGGTNWVYGLTYLGNAPANGSGAEVASNGRIYVRANSAAASHGFSGLFVDRNSASSNHVPWSFENEWGNHSWGVVARFHISQASADRPSILFSNATNNTRWGVGYCQADDNFRISQNIGMAPDGSGGSWGTERFRIDTSGNIYAGGIFESGSSLRAPIFYDSNDTGYYLDPNGASNLQSWTSDTAARIGRSRYWTNRWAIYGTANDYMTGTNGWGTEQGTWANAWKGGFSGWDIWGTGTDHPQGGGYIHAQGIVSGQHAASSDGSSAYGWMMVGAHNATENRYWLRGKWSTSTSGWVEMITTGNIGSQSVSYASSAGNADTVDGYHVAVGGSANTIPTRNGSGYLIPENWIQLNGIYGLYSPTNNAHLRPNDASYGSWLMTGSRNGWQGIEFNSGGAGNITLMLHTDSNTVGFHNNSYGWQIRWANGTLFCGKNSYGGNDATVWDSSNAPRASNSLLMYYQGFTLDANTMDGNSSGFTYSVNAPYTGPIVRFSETGYSLQLNAAYGGSGNLIAFRTRNGDNGTWNPWREIITTGNIGNQSVSYANNAGNVSSISGAVNGVYTWTNLNYFRSNRNTSSDSPPLQAFSDNGSGAIMSFHRGGYYAVNFGLDSDNVMRIGGWSAAGNRWQLDMSGNMTVAGDVTAYSDARVKENIKTIENALDKVLGLRGVSYNRTDSDDKKTKIGVIAQETLPIVPEVVNQDNDGMYNVSYGNLGGLFIEAFKEQQKRIEAQDKVIEELKSKLDGITK